MAENQNGGWTKWLVSIIWGIVVLTLVTTVNNVIANDKESRLRDSDICEKMTRNKEERLNDVNLILIALAGIKTELIYIRRQVEDNGHSGKM